MGACSPHRQRQNNDLCSRELMHGKIKLMTAVCPEWAHCLGWRPEFFHNAQHISGNIFTIGAFFFFNRWGYQAVF